MQAIYAYWVLHGVASFEIDPPDEGEMARRREAVVEKGLPTSSRCQATLYRPREAYRFTVEDSVYVAPEFVGQGIGRRLLERVVEQSAGAGYRQMIAVRGAENEVAPVGSRGDAR